MTGMDGTGASVTVSPTSRRRIRATTAKVGGQIVLLDGAREIELRSLGRYRLDASLWGALKSAPGVLMLEDA